LFAFLSRLLALREVADLLNLDQTLLTPGANAELLQVVHYDPAQKYDAHHDWGVDPPSGKRGPDGLPFTAPSRFVTLLLYLNDPEAGGQTAFPKALGADGEPIALHPGKVACLKNNNYG
jgi:prolyl 4-hydroxylase